jgi:hypothetical protein
MQRTSGNALLLLSSGTRKVLWNEIRAGYTCLCGGRFRVILDFHNLSSLVLFL